MLFSVHIPKCGGTSFRVYLEHRLGSGFLYDYSRRWERRHLAELLPLLEGKVCFHAHTASNLLDGVFDDLKKITWIRNPVDRILSYYSHILWQKEVGNEFFRQVVESGMDVVEFAKLSWVSNGITRYLSHSIESFQFIGIIEEQTQSMAKFEKIIETEVQLEKKICLPRLNTKEDHTGASMRGFRVCKSDRIAIAKANALDLEFYIKKCEDYGLKKTEYSLVEGI